MLYCSYQTCITYLFQQHASIMGSFPLDCIEILWWAHALLVLYNCVNEEPVEPREPGESVEPREPGEPEQTVEPTSTEQTYGSQLTRCHQRKSHRLSLILRLSPRQRRRSVTCASRISRTTQIFSSVKASVKSLVHRYCVGVTVSHYREIETCSMPFVCVVCTHTSSQQSARPSPPFLPSPMPSVKSYFRE